MSRRTDSELIGDILKAARRVIARTRYPDMPWKQMAGSRDRLIHHYFGVNIDIIWQVADVELPRVVEMLAATDENESGV